MTTKKKSTDGYSQTPLVRKLGIREGQRLIFLNAPESYGDTLGRLPDGVVMASELDGPLDFIQFFSSRTCELEAIFPGLRESLAPDGMLWVSWPKGASKVDTDLNGNVVREIGLRNGLVDVKVCAVDDTWSGLKFVYRLKDRV